MRNIQMKHGEKEAYECTIVTRNMNLVTTQYLFVEGLHDGTHIFYRAQCGFI